MTCLVAIEPDPKSAKLIEECWKDISKEGNHKVLIYSALNELAVEFSKPENSADTIAVLMVPIEALGTDVELALQNLTTTYKCDILVSLFDDPTKSATVKKLENSIIKNLMYKPFDPTILKEHTRFALIPSSKVKALFVHTTVAKNKLEALKKFKFTQLAESGFKIEKQFPLELGKTYKFYHPYFQYQRNQNVWGRVIHEDAQGYELTFAQISKPALAAVRRKIADVKQRFKNPVWSGHAEHKQSEIDIVIHIEDEALGLMIQQLIERTFNSNIIMHRKDFKTPDKIQADLVITDAAYEVKSIQNDFVNPPAIIRVHQPENIGREQLEERLLIEYFRLELPLDKAFLMKAMKVIFPLLQEKEPSHLTTVPPEGLICLSEHMEVEEFSEAAMSFNKAQPFKVNDMIDIALTQEDETDLKEMKVKIHYVDAAPSPEKLYSHQAVLYGMKDEFLKQIRLWTLHAYIEKNKNK